MKTCLHTGVPWPIARWGLMPAVFVLLCSCFFSGSLEPGDRAPAFDLKELGGEALRFDPASGRIHVLYFWADWCPRCEEDFRLMDRLYAEWKRKPNGPRLLAIDVGQTEEHVRNFVKRIKCSFPIYMDPDGKTARRFGVKGLPTYFITDGEGTIRHIVLGWADEKTLLAEIEGIDQPRTPRP